MEKSTPENEYSARVIEEINVNELKSIVKENEKSSYSARFSGVIWFLKFVLMPILILISVLTEHSYVYTSIYSVSGMSTLAWAVSIIFIIIVEGIKLGLGYKLFWFIVNNWFKEGRHYIYSFIMMLFIVASAFLASIVCSIKGIPTTFEIFAEWIYNPPNEDLIEIDRQIADARATKTSKGETTYASTKTIATLSEQRSSIVEKINSDRIRFKERVKTIGSNFSLFGGGWESLTILSLLMFATYRRYSYIEMKNTNELEQIRNSLGSQSVKKK